MIGVLLPMLCSSLWQGTDRLNVAIILRDVYKQEYPDFPAELTRLLQNKNLATDDGCLFTATVHRKPAGELDLVNSALKGSPKTDTVSGKRRVSVGKTSEKILEACRENNAITISELAAMIGVSERSIERNLQKLQKNGLLQRIGGRKEGY